MKPVLENAAGSNQPETFGGKFKIPNSKVVTKKPGGDKEVGIF